ncbi:hypothetical protein AVM47_033695 [Pseudomonas aeruginosa]|uniref:hypothetical protein n=1 Tax=Pseudomonas aeruginosa TaxID=287 RepID=UPI00076C2BD2|nr:hypothetical protein [Pseudomonas aeruginosa]MBK1802856.1 hypothetical protein [Pseudomonas aeruginosa]MBM2530472.1 hypothetical protein [Pseudomonas aeruginosa]MCA6854761.1 hypothetical protein [Pseudomonas aeruginosa]HCI1729314.1 hypothetical protein [Pseudomonas aeruginosa]HCI1799716.1 hypothetical protein [Pseudomonas aeruginosa]
MNGPTLELIEGATFGFEVTWSDSTGAPIDVTGCAARFVICPADSTRPLVACSTEDGGIALGGIAGTVAVSLAPAKTAGTHNKQWQGARYELRVEYPSGDVYSLLRGTVALSPGLL